MNNDVFTHGSLFSGIGGFDLAAEWMGWENIFNCEIESFPRKILNYYWPNVISYEDITKTDFTVHRGEIDILTGGFPCQPYSLAGKRKGTEDARHLWPEMLRAIREIQPSYVVGENVYGIVNWNGGLVFNEVQADMEAEGYEVQSVILPACGVNAPHKRERVWFIAYSKNKRRGTRQRKDSYKCRRRIKRHKSFNMEAIRDRIEPNGLSRFTSDTECERQQGSRWSERQMHTKAFGNRETSWTNTDGGWPTQPPVRRGDDGFSERLGDITISRWRKESIKAYGNAIVPQIAFELFSVIEKLHNNRAPI